MSFVGYRIICICIAFGLGATRGSAASNLYPSQLKQNLKKFELLVNHAASQDELSLELLLGIQTEINNLIKNYPVLTRQAPVGNRSTFKQLLSNLDSKTRTDLSLPRSLTDYLESISGLGKDPRKDFIAYLRAIYLLEEAPFGLSEKNFEYTLAESIHDRLETYPRDIDLFARGGFHSNIEEKTQEAYLFIQDLEYEKSAIQWLDIIWSHSRVKTKAQIETKHVISKYLSYQILLDSITKIYATYPDLECYRAFEHIKRDHPDFPSNRRFHRPFEDTRKQR